MESSKSPRMRCEEHDLATGPDGMCVLCRRDAMPPPPRSRNLVRVGVAVGALTMLFGGAAFARGVVASRAARAAAAASPELPIAPRVGVAPPPAAADPPPKAHLPEATTPPPAPTPNTRLDEALATVPAATPPPARPVDVAATPNEAQCLCRVRTPHPIQAGNPWGPGHDRDGHLHTRSHLKAEINRPIEPTAPKCTCPPGTVHVRTHPGGSHAHVSSIE